MLKARAVLVESDLYDLFAELWIARREVQQIVDALWELDGLPTLNWCHQMFYKELRGKGFRSHHAKRLYKYARALVEAALRQYRDRFYAETLDWTSLNVPAQDAEAYSAPGQEGRPRDGRYRVPRTGAKPCCKSCQR